MDQPNSKYVDTARCCGHLSQIMARARGESARRAAIPLGTKLLSLNSMEGPNWDLQDYGNHPIRMTE
jgi:hypothetical protein